MFHKDAGSPWYKFIYDGYKAYDTGAGIMKSVTGGDLDYTGKTLFKSASNSLLGKK